MNRSIGVYLLIGLNVVCYLLEQSMGDPFIAQFALMPLGQGFMPWQVVTYAFLHGGIEHIAFNMFGLWMFGATLRYRSARCASWRSISPAFSLRQERNCWSRR